MQSALTFKQEFQNQQTQLEPFQQALKHIDQVALSDLFTYAQRYLAPAALSNRLHPFELMVLTMLMEEHKEVLRLSNQIELLQASRADKS